MNVDSKNMIFQTMIFCDFQTWLENIKCLSSLPWTKYSYNLMKQPYLFLSKDLKKRDSYGLVN